MRATTKIRRILGGRSPAEFAELPKESREAIFHRHLVGNRLSNDKGPDPKVMDGVMLRQQYFMGEDAVGRQLVEEARGIYYAWNEFTVDSEFLSEFIRDPLADGVPMAVESLVRNITVRVNIHD